MERVVSALRDGGIKGFEIGEDVGAEEGGDGKRSWVCLGVSIV